MKLINIRRPLGRGACDEIRERIAVGVEMGLEADEDLLECLDGLRLGRLLSIQMFGQPAPAAVGQGEMQRGAGPLRWSASLRLDEPGFH